MTFDLIAIIVWFSFMVSAGIGFFNASSPELTRIQYQPANQPILLNQNKLATSTAASVMVLDNNSGAGLWEKNSTTTLPIASITKLMTALVFLRTQPVWDQVVKIEESDARDGGLVQLVAGDEVKVRDLFNLMLISSTNEAAAALARISNLKDFVGEMNNQAQSMGLKDTKFVDPTGLDPKNVSTAKDLARLAQTAFLKKEIIGAVTSSEYNFKTQNFNKEIKVASTDLLLDSFLNKDDYKIVGAKTGYLSEIGYCLLMSVQRRDNKSLTLVILGAPTQFDRWSETKSLVDWAWKNYKF
ncbi:MAG: serine hydrolase [Candidatus Buchananbacteria bacterium]